jgi:hypothetical protein
MSPLFAAYADQIILDALERFLPIAGIAIAFGVVYWFIRSAQVKRQDAERKQWIEERRAKRTERPKEPAEPPQA